MKKNKMLNMALASTMAAGAIVAIAPTEVDAAKSFPDVKENSSHYENIMNLVERGIIQGYEDGTFKPGDSIKRGHAAKIIAGILELDTVNVKNPGFKDISAENPYYGAIAALANAGIINGFEDNTYRHNDTLTRGQMSKIIAIAFKLEAGDSANPFTDVANSQYKDYVTALFANNVTTGKTATTFDAKSPVTRAQLASFVVRAESVGSETETPVAKTITVKILEVKENEVVTDNGTFATTGDLVKVFNATNAAALKDAQIEVVVEDEISPVASLNFFGAVNTVKIASIKSLTLVADNATFSAGGYEIPQVTVNGKGIEVKDLKVGTLKIAKGLSVKITGVEVGELDVREGAKVTLDPTSVITKVTLPKNLSIQNVITNYNQIKNVIKEVSVDQNVTAPTTGGGGGGGGKKSDNNQTEAQEANATINKLITAVVESNATYYEKFGELTDASAPSFVFNFEDSYQNEKLQVIKNEVEGFGSTIKADVLEIVLDDHKNLTHFLNIKEITAKSNGKKSTILNGYTNSIDLEEYLEEEVNKASVAEALGKFMDHDTARDTTVSQFIDQYNEFEIQVTFTDNSVINYTIELKK